jgi:hypothetical protein
MVKRISILLLVSIVLITGYISLRKLNYWDRSVMIFKINSSEQSFQGRGGRGFGESEGREPGGRHPEFREGMQRPEGMNFPDSLRRRSEGRGQRNFNRMRTGPDSLASTRIARDTTFSARGDFGGRPRGMDRNEGRDFRRGKAVNLNLVGYYLAVFALFALIMVYLEKGYRLIFKNKNKFQENSDLII